MSFSLNADHAGCVILRSVSDVGEFVRAKASSGPSEAKAATLATMKADTVQLRALKALGSPAGPMKYLSGAAADQVPFGAVSVHAAA